MLFVVLVVSVAVQASGWRRLWRHVEARSVTRLGASLRYGLWALAPLFLFVGSIFTAVGLEEWLGVSLVSELMGRATLPVAASLLGLATAGWICFAARCALSRRRGPRERAVEE